MNSLSIALAAAVGLALTTPAAAAPPPVAAFGRIPAIVEASISPNGQHVAILGGAPDQRIVSIATIDQPNLPTLPLGPVEAVDLHWVGDAYVLARVALWKETAPRQIYRLERNIGIDLQAHTTAVMLGQDAISAYLVEQPVIGAVANPPRALVRGLAMSEGPSSDLNTHLARKGVDNPFVTALYSVDPVNGHGTLVERGTYDTANWDVDEQGHPRVRLDVDALTSGFTVMGRAAGRSQYAQVWKGGYASRLAYIGYSAPEDAVYMDMDNQVVRIKLADGAREPVGPAHPNANAALLWDELRLAPVGLDITGQQDAITWTDAQLGAVHATLSRALKGKTVSLANWSADRTRLVVRADAQDSPPVWYLFDTTRKELSPLGEEYPELKGVALGATQAITYKARDGLTIPAYVTLPPGAAHGAKLPLVVLPHGGPTARDDNGFDWLTQFLASRGYAVLRPQFRGSWGYGDAFEKAGEGEWAGKMQTDLLDGVAALAASGDIDPKRVCIVGASFGGYAAMAGAALHGDSYRCAAAIAGISDLGLLVVEEGRIYGRDAGSIGELRAMLGQAPREQLFATSPDKLAGKVNIPLLLIHGDKDTVVMPEQSKLMADAMAAAGKPVEYVVLKDENHYLVNAATRIQTLQTLEAFLARNLPAQP